MAAWLVLILSFPAHPSSLRVKAWRRLRGVGAVTYGPWDLTSKSSMPITN